MGRNAIRSLPMHSPPIHSPPMQGWQAAALSELSHPEGTAAFLLGISWSNCQRAQTYQGQAPDRERHAAGVLPSSPNLDKRTRVMGRAILRDFYVPQGGRMLQT